MLQQTSAKIEKILQILTLVISGIFCGLLIWTTLGISPYAWIKSEPIRGTEFLVRLICLPLCILLVLSGNWFFYKFYSKTTSWFKVLLISMAGFNIAYFLTAFGYAIADPIIYDSYARNIVDQPLLLILAIWITNVIAFVPIVIFWLILSSISKFVNCSALK